MKDKRPGRPRWFFWRVLDMEDLICLGLLIGATIGAAVGVWRIMKDIFCDD